MTISGTSNLSACTVHAYKRYSFGVSHDLIGDFKVRYTIISSYIELCMTTQDLLVGFDFAPVVFFNEERKSLEVDMSLVHDVKEQGLGTGE